MIKYGFRLNVILVILYLVSSPLVVADASYSSDSYETLYTASSPNITDGIKDSIWQNQNWTNNVLNRYSGTGPLSINMAFSSIFDDNNIYFAFERLDNIQIDWEWVGVKMDTDQDGDWNEYVDFFITYYRSSGDTYSSSDMASIGTGSSTDTVLGGEDNTAGSGSYNGTGWYFELSQELNSGDTNGYDINIAEGETIEFKIYATEADGSYESAYSSSVMAMTLINPLPEFSNSLIIMSLVSFSLIIVNIFRKRLNF